MNWFGQLLVRLHAELIKLYPAEFRESFGAEMSSVFTEALTEARYKGIHQMIVLFLREIRDHPAVLWRERRAKRREKIGSEKLPAFNLHDSVPDREPYVKPSGPATAAAILPFLLVGLFYLSQAVNFISGSRAVSFNWYLLLYLLLLTGFGLGWIRGFPRWSMGYLGMVLTFSWWLAGLTTSGYRNLGHSFGHNEQWGWRGWIAVVVFAAAAALVSRSFDPVKSLARGIWRDWSRLSFIIYGGLAWLATGITYDGKSFYGEIGYLVLNLTSAAIIFTAGAFLYMQLKTSWQRALVLQLAFNLAFLSSIAVVALDGRRDVDLPDQIFYWFFVFIFWFGLILLPGILSVFRRAYQRANPA